MKVLFYKNYVSKDLKGLSETDRKIFKNFIDFVKLKNPPISDPHISKLKGFENIFRFKKIGKKIRIIFYMENDLIMIIGISYRKEVYTKVLNRI